MPASQRKKSMAIFVVTLVCFFLPFLKITCQGHQITAITGVQLATGFTINEPGSWGQRGTHRTAKPEPFAIASIGAAILGLASGFMRTGKEELIAGLSGAAGTICLLILKAKIDASISRETGIVVSLHYEIGFWITLLCFILAIAVNFINYSRQN